MSDNAVEVRGLTNISAAILPMIVLFAVSLILLTASYIIVSIQFKRIEDCGHLFCSCVQAVHKDAAAAKY